MRRRSKLAIVLSMSVVVLGWIQQAGAILNNGFETDYVYILKDTGVLRAVSESDGVQQGSDILPEGSAATLTFAGTGSNDARLFLARVSGNDIEIGELNASGTLVNGPVSLSALVGTTFASPPVIGGLRYDLIHNTLLIGLNPSSTAGATATAYEIDLALSSRIHTYLGPSLPAPVADSARNVNIAINSRNGALYMISRHLGSATSDGLGDLVAFNTAGRVVGGTTSTYTTLIDGASYPAGQGYTQPHTVIFRERAGIGSDDTVVICMQPSSSVTPAKEFWLDTTAHPSGNPNYLALRGSPISVGRGWNGQQDRVTGHIWLGALRYGFFVLRADDSTTGYENISPNNRAYSDAASPFSPAPQAPVIAEVAPDPLEVPAGVPYVQQLSLLVGTPAPAWSVVQGPTGTQVDSTGKVTGWTPSPGDMGKTITFEIRADNGVSPADTELWHVKVLQTNNGFINDYVYVVRSPDNGGQLRKYRRSDGATIADLLPDQTDWMTSTFSGKGKGNDARFFVAKLIPPTDPEATGANPDQTGTDIILAELDYAGNTLKSTNLSTIIGGPVGAAVALGNLRYSSISDTLFVGLNPDVNANSTAVAYEIDLGLSTRIHTYLGEAVGINAIAPAFNGRVTVAVNRRNGMLYMTSQNMGDATGAGLGDVIAFDTAGRAVGGTTSTYTVLIDGQTCNAGNASYIQPSSPIYRKRAGDDDTLLIPTNTDVNTTVLEFYLNTTLHPKDTDGNLAQRTDSPTLLSVGRGWNGQQEPGSGDVWLGAMHHGFHLIAADDTTASYETSNPGRDWTDAAVPPFSPCSEPAADLDGDGDVDQADFAVFQTCFTGGGAPLEGLSQTCACVDLGDDDNNGVPNYDRDIDGFDHTAFEACASGPGVPADPMCGGG